MPRIPPVTTAGLDDTNRRRRHREVTDLMLNFQHDDSRIRSPAEVAAGVTPHNSAYVYSPSVDARRYGLDESKSASYNSAAMADAVEATTGFRTLILPSGMLDFDPTVVTIPAHILGAGTGKHGTSGHLGRTVIRCTDTNEFAWTLKRTQINGYDPFHVQGIRFFGAGVGYGGVHFGSDVAAGGVAGVDYSNLTGLIEDCHFNQFTDYGLALRRLFDAIIRRVNCTEIRDASTLSTSGRGIALLVNDETNAGSVLDMTVITLDNCDTSQCHLGVYVEECEVLRIINHQASNNNREAIKFFSREYINAVRIEGGYYEQNNASRNDSGYGGGYPRKYYDIDFERENPTLKASNYIFGVVIENPYMNPIGDSGKIHFQHMANAWLRHRTSSADDELLAIGNDATGIVLEITNDLHPYNAGATDNHSVLANLSTKLVARNVDVYEITGTFTATLTGVSGTVTGTVHWKRSGNRVTLFFLTTFEGTSTSTSMTFTGLPAALQPVHSNWSQVVSEIENAGSSVDGVALFAAGSDTVTFYVSTVSGSLVTRSPTGFTASSVKGIFAGCRLDYYLD
jgi:hypothetical protein